MACQGYHKCLLDDEETEDLDKRVSQLMDRALHSPEDFKMLSQDVKNTVCLRHRVVSKATQSADDTGDDHSSEDENEEYITSVETLLCHENAVPNCLEEPDPWPGSSTLPGLKAADWQRFQRQDATIKRVMYLMESGTTLSGMEKRHESCDVCLLWKERPRLKYIDRVLYRQVSNQVGQCHNQLVIPEITRKGLWREYMTRQGTWDMKERWSWLVLGFIGQKWQQMLNRNLKPVNGV